MTNARDETLAQEFERLMVRYYEVLAKAKEPSLEKVNLAYFAINNCVAIAAALRAATDTRTREALQALHDHIAEYARINNLGGFDNHVMKQARAALRATPPATDTTFQSRVKPWTDACFGPEISADKIERNHRFLEEALELVQACGCTQSEAHQLVDYVYGRDQGDINQEVGGVMVTLAALCLANNFDMHSAGETELARVWTKVEKIRAKQAAKPKHSPLPEHVPAPDTPVGERRPGHSKLVYNKATRTIDTVRAGDQFNKGQTR